MSTPSLPPLGREYIRFGDGDWELRDHFTVCSECGTPLGQIQLRQTAGALCMACGLKSIESPPQLPVGMIK